MTECWVEIDGWWNDEFRRTVIQSEISSVLVLTFHGEKSGVEFYRTLQPFVPPISVP